MKRNLVAVAFGKDGTQGESAFVPTDDDRFSGFPLQGVCENYGMTQLKRLFKEHCRYVGLSPDVIETPAGFWLLTDESFEVAMRAKRLIEKMTSATEYVANGIVKRLLASMAVKTVGDKSAIEVDP